MSYATSPNDPTARTDLGTVVQQQLLDALGDDTGQRLRARQPDGRLQDINRPSVSDAPIGRAVPRDPIRAAACSSHMSARFRKFNVRRGRSTGRRKLQSPPLGRPTERASSQHSNVQPGAIEVDAEVVGHRPLQHGVTLVVATADPDEQPADDDSVLTVNLYRRGGLPSRVVPTGGPRPAFTGRVVAALEAWIETVRMQARPVAPELEELVGRLSVRLGAHGYDLQACSPADYQVTFALSALGRTERFTYHHRADGQLTGRLRGDASSDLYAILDAAIRQDIP